MKLPTGIIMSTAKNDIRIAVEAIKRGAEDYLVKPYELEELKLALKKMIEKKNLRSRIETLESEIEYLQPKQE